MNVLLLQVNFHCIFKVVSYVLLILHCIAIVSGAVVVLLTVVTVVLVVYNYKRVKKRRYRLNSSCGFHALSVLVYL